ncbi:Lrp/AsnC family transcriptional regulator [Paracoccus denitrificans]|jgi:Lrp/AsnC family leucine-responsive transcriptional regulator|uniref:Transcriptional regulator, AsnC family n=1 Tax=Paracoccus denitrificans (strain Pd 1222) TaxID=318586 RepID=A1B225_PARDP|nr:Lrp/AsnC family transcriptional regulator [Paracoccus denitrificans]ABL69569.1 transcriptional regulator, AsnC family [Paracoccus denitrificans PD1222]MBB4626817.1 Lrp/AsnC family leucine-responsive transcriptional regulator [Paracoccus denitrificans]MCU7427700.1 Lrp/AsnC family transcriptional regulator [Paracoccus denitrificans]QAR24960.1 Lrp/AsnC family transcriptional regulator [Paracoccus denitrificans]UPV93861.1 Lrp/AsnC family transcriptional regulator [Paracoccus denitrificans]
MPISELDRLDIAILEALQENARTPLSEVGRRVGLSQPATSERVKRLEDRGILAGYTARLDAAALGLGMMAIIRLKTTHEHIKPALKAFAEMPHVIEVHRLTGEDCFLLKVLVPTPGQLETIVDTIARFGAVTTSLVLRSEPVKPLGKALLG